MNKVVLLEDHQFGHQFSHVFGTCDRYFTVGEMAAAGGGGWEYAFIDFELADKYTGLGALIYLREYSPQTKVVVFTAIGERGRTLFALAARCWFDAWALLDKGLASDETLGMVKDGVNPTTDVWTARLERNGWMINILFLDADRGTVRIRGRIMFSEWRCDCGCESAAWARPSLSPRERRTGALRPIIWFPAFHSPDLGKR